MHTARIEISLQDCATRAVYYLSLHDALDLVDGLIHRVGAAVGIKNGAAFDVTRAAANRLNQRSGAAKIALLIGVENRDERNFRQVQTFAQQVDSDEHVKFTAAQIAQNLDA